MGKGRKRRDRRAEREKKAARAAAEAGTKRREHFWGVVVGVLVILPTTIISIYLFHRFFELRAKTAETYSWRPTEGEIVKSEVGSVEHTVFGTSFQGRQRSSSVEELWFPDLEYRYVVDGKGYAGSQITRSLRRVYQTEEWARTEGQKYPVGAQVTVYYSASDPSKAVLIRGDPGGWRWLSLIGACGSALFPLIWIPIAFVGPWLAARREKRKQAAEA